MGVLKYEKLFEPIRLGRTLFRNRIFSSPQDIYRLTSENFLDDNATMFYEVKALGGFASVCIGDMMVDTRAGHSHPFQLRGDDVKGRGSFTRTSEAIKRHGAVAAVELNHAGKNGNVMAANEGFIYGLIDEVRPDGVEIRAMDEEWIERLIKCHADAALFAKQCGFGMITLHGGHGWLLAQFMSPRDNKRTDRWGGSIENRMRFPLAVIEAVRRAVGPDMPIEIRISGSECLDDGYDIDEGVRIAKALDGKVDLIHVSAGHHEVESASMITHPTMFLPDGVNVKYAAEIKKHVTTPVATVGALTDPAMMEEIILSGKADVVQLGRQTLADPYLPLKARLGHEEDIDKCLRCMTCFSRSTASGIFYCAINPVIGHESDVIFGTPPRKPRRVLVVGGGVGGMQAALTASERGHEVILCEKTGELGGTLRCERNVPFKAKLGEYLDRQALRISKNAIEVRLNTEVTPKLAMSLRPDVIIAALGARPVVPGIPGIEHALMAEDVYLDPTLAGDRVAIIGGGLVGLELGVFLAGLGRTVNVVEMLPTTLASTGDVETSEMISNPGLLEAGANIVQGVALSEELKKLPKLAISVSTKALEITTEGLAVEDRNGKLFIDADTVVCAVGQRPLMEEAAALYDCAPEFYQIGDCLSPKDVVTATQTAYQIARDIGRY
ncbi:MAG: FAD-dependent oxidoreductase [Oscillospiraceae bacterium]|nr:FAD-dependent oxidoreductase [Oscillospiraceae bacterium]